MYFVLVFRLYLILYFSLLWMSAIYLSENDNNNSSRVKENFDRGSLNGISLLILCSAIFVWKSAIYLTTAPYTKRRKFNRTSFFKHIWFVRIWVFTCQTWIKSLYSQSQNWYCNMHDHIVHSCTCKRLRFELRKLFIMKLVFLFKRPFTQSLHFQILRDCRFAS